MKIVNIIGGLGNQMFQYAFALSLQEKFPHEEVLIDVSHFHYLFMKKWGAANLHNGYEINKIFPNATLRKASIWQLMRVTWVMPNYFLSRILRRLLPKRKTEFIQSPSEYFVFNPNVYGLTGSFYYEGIWESISYYLPIQDKIRQIFQHPQPNKINAAYINRLKTTNSVGIHVRRGDYLSTAIFKGICEVDYYRRAIAEILKDGQMHSFFIFSNDMKWCRNNILPLIGDNEYIEVRENTGENSCWDMFLMSYCSDLIIANSSFSWWGAFLNTRGGTVIAPRRWANRNAQFDIWASAWVRL